MKHLIWLIFLGGCASYAQVQVDLLKQVDQGLVQAQQSLEQSSQLISAYHDLRRQRLDEAFDVDVRERPQLDADWVVEHRKAYVTAIDLLHAAQDRSGRAVDVDRRNLAALRDAVGRVIWLQNLQLKLISPGDQP